MERLYRECGEDDLGPDEMDVEEVGENGLVDEVVGAVGPRGEGLVGKVRVVPAESYEERL
jgi:hypothetical protein